MWHLVLLVVATLGALMLMGDALREQPSAGAKMAVITSATIVLTAIWWK